MPGAALRRIDIDNICNILQGYQFLRIYCFPGFDNTEGNILHFGEEVDAIDGDECDAVGVGVGVYEIVHCAQ